MGENVAFILGYTGATGKAVVQELAKSDYFKKVVLVGRRKCDLPIGADDRFVQMTVDYDNIGDYRHVFKDCTVGYCCLGCQHLSNLIVENEEFTRIDRDYVINTARVAREAGCKQFHVVTALKPDPNSKIYYRKLKGQTEEGLKQLAFPKLNIYRPGFIRAKREGRRLALDRVYTCLVFLPWLICRSKNTKSIEVDRMAKAMLYKTQNPSDDSVDVLENADMFELTRG